MLTTVVIRQRFDCLRLVALLALLVVPELAAAQLSGVRSIDGTYELAKRVMADGTVLRAPAVSGLYTLRRGRFHLNLFFKKPDGTIASATPHRPSRLERWVS